MCHLPGGIFWLSQGRLCIYCSQVHDQIWDRCAQVPCQWGSRPETSILRAAIWYRWWTKNLLRRLHPNSRLCCRSVLCKWLWWTMSPIVAWPHPTLFNKLKLYYTSSIAEGTSSVTYGPKMFCLMRMVRSSSSTLTCLAATTWMFATILCLQTSRKGSTLLTRLREVPKNMQYLAIVFLHFFLSNFPLLHSTILIGRRIDKKRFFAKFLRNQSWQCYGKNEKFANFYPDLGMNSY